MVVVVVTVPLPVVPGVDVVVELLLVVLALEVVMGPPLVVFSVELQLVVLDVPVAVSVALVVDDPVPVEVVPVLVASVLVVVVLLPPPEESAVEPDPSVPVVHVVVLVVDGGSLEVVGTGVVPPLPVPVVPDAVPSPEPVPAPPPPLVPHEMDRAIRSGPTDRRMAENLAPFGGEENDPLRDPHLRQRHVRAARQSSPSKRRRTALALTCPAAPLSA